MPTAFATNTQIYLVDHTGCQDGWKVMGFAEYFLQFCELR